MSALTDHLSTVATLATYRSPEAHAEAMWRLSLERRRIARQRELVIFHRRLTALLVLACVVIMAFVVWWLPIYCAVAALVFRYGVMVWGGDN